MLLTLDPVALPAAPPIPAFADAPAFAAWLSGPTRETWSADLLDAQYGLALWCDDPQDAAHVAGLLGYFLAGPLAIGAEWAPDALPPSLAGHAGHCFLFWCDLTKSRRDDWAAVLSDPATGLAAHLTAGSPVRKTNQAGPGTQGTRKWAGLAGRVLVAWR